jgi:hypothetical protein
MYVVYNVGLRVRSTQSAENAVRMYSVKHKESVEHDRDSDWARCSIAFTIFWRTRRLVGVCLSVLLAAGCPDFLPGLPETPKVIAHVSGSRSLHISCAPPPPPQFIIDGHPVSKTRFSWSSPIPFVIYFWFQINPRLQLLSVWKYSLFILLRWNFIKYIMYLRCWFNTDAGSSWMLSLIWSLLSPVGACAFRSIIR